MLIVSNIALNGGGAHALSSELDSKKAKIKVNYHHKSSPYYLGLCMIIMIIFIIILYIISSVAMALTILDNNKSLVMPSSPLSSYHQHNI